MFGLIRKKDLKAFAERVNEDNILDAKMGAPGHPYTFEEQKRAAHCHGYAEGSRAFFLALLAFLDGGKPQKKKRSRRRIARKPVQCSKTYREAETIITVTIDNIDKNVSVPEDFDVVDYKAWVEKRVRRVISENSLGDAYTQVKVQVFLKDDEEAGR